MSGSNKQKVNKHYCEAMHEALVHEQERIAERFRCADESQRRWLREQLLANERAFKRLREREEREMAK